MKQNAIYSSKNRISFLPLYLKEVFKLKIVNVLKDSFGMVPRGNSSSESPMLPINDRRHIKIQQEIYWHDPAVDLTIAHLLYLHIRTRR